MCLFLCPDFSPSWDAAWCPATIPISTQHCSVKLSISNPSINFFALLEIKFSQLKRPTTLSTLMDINLAYMTQRIKILQFSNTIDPKAKFLMFIEAESTQSVFYQQHQMLLRVLLQAGNTDSLSRAHFMVCKPLQTTDSIHVCCHLITAVVVWSLKAVKWENPTAQACNQSLTAR